MQRINVTRENHLESVNRLSDDRPLNHQNRSRPSPWKDENLAIGENATIAPASLPFLHPIRNPVSPIVPKAERKDDDREHHHSATWPNNPGESIAHLRNCLAVEISCRQHLEAKLRHSEQINQSLLNAIHESAFLINADGVVLGSNQTAAQRLGVSLNQLIGSCLYDYFPPAVFKRRKAWIEKVFQTGEPARVEDSRDRYYFDTSYDPVFDDNGEITALTIFARDITAQKQAVQQLQESEGFYRTILTSISDAVFITDDMGEIQFICPNAEGFFGLSVAEMNALGNIDRILGENLFDPEALKITGTIENIERDFTDIAGKQRTMLVNVKQVAIENGTRLYTCRDITDRKQAQQETLQVFSQLQESEDRFHLLLEGAQDSAMFNLDATGHVSSWNSVAERITGYLADEIIGQHLSCFYQPQAIEQGKPGQILDVATQTGRANEKGWHLRSDGVRFWADFLITPSWDDVGNLRGFSVVLRDLTERKQLQDTLWHAALHDPLTGLLNRTMFSRCLSHAWEKAQKHQKHLFAVLFLDLDRFKLVNDSLGHDIGDELLVAFARRLETCVRSQDPLARLGGDEFAILLEDIDDVDGAIAVAQRIQSCLEEPFQLKGHELFVNTSIGIAFNRTAQGDTSSGTSPSDPSIPLVSGNFSATSPTNLVLPRPEDLLRQADTAMYEAKRKGQGNFVVFNSPMLAGLASRLELEHDLRQILPSRPDRPNHPNHLSNPQELPLYYQPIVSLKTGMLTGFEALVRWQHPTRGMISPIEFIPLAEETGLIIPLGTWVLREACGQLRRWQDKFPHTQKLTMNVNLSAKQLAQPDLLMQIDQILEETGINPTCLKLEITESMLMENALQSTELLEQLRTRKIELCIDDFGTGYSSLSHLRSLPVNVLKIDRSFIRGLGKDQESSQIVQTILSLARHLGLSVVCEGIETKEQLAQLSAWQCDYGQGYFWGKPSPADLALAWVTNKFQCAVDF
jgi:diguanylate cyclase (GGDEF)-like protein/PAS domain S-box-containing protein